MSSARQYRESVLWASLSCFLFPYSLVNLACDWISSGSTCRFHIKLGCSQAHPRVNDFPSPNDLLVGVHSELDFRLENAFIHLVTSYDCNSSVVMCVLIGDHIFIF